MIGAFFDFDGTLYTGHIWQVLAQHHWAARRHRRWVVAYVARNMAPVPLYRLGLLTQVDFYGAWGETMGWLLRGWTVEEGQALFEQLTETRIMPNLRPEILELVRDHQERRHLVALVSGTFSPWLELVAQRLDIPHAIGTPLEVRAGRYTGRILPPLCQGPGKPARIHAYLAKQGLGAMGMALDWQASFGYADSGTDVDLLGELGTPVAVYPDRDLLGHARAQGWEVIGEPSL
jgi:HAD superfamily hydrolase (TIGR01490 family)